MGANPHSILKGFAQFRVPLPTRLDLIINPVPDQVQKPDPYHPEYRDENQAAGGGGFSLASSAAAVAAASLIC